MKNTIIGIIALLLFFNIFSPMAISTDLAQQSKRITFKSYVNFEYDTSALNEPLAIDVSVSIPITIKYWTNIPDMFKKIPFPLNNMILFGSMIGPMQTIHLEVLDPPEWANIYISSPDILTEIPLASDGVVKVETNLILSLRVEAPAKSYRIGIKATWDSIKRLVGNSYQESIEFTPAYIPGFSVAVSNSSVNTPPDKKTIIPIKVTNFANKISSIKPSIVDNLSDFSIKLNPPSLELDIGQTGTIDIEVVPQSDFQGNITIQIDFLMEQYPYRSGSASLTHSVNLELNHEPEISEEDQEFNMFFIFQ